MLSKLVTTVKLSFFVFVPTEARKKDKGGGGYLLMSALMMGKHDAAHNK